MNPLPLPNVLAGTGGTLRGDLPPATTFPKIERNSRHVVPGDLFIAIRGERFDGHQFVPDAIACGAAAAMVSESWANEHPEIEAPVIVVDEPIVALQRLARWRRERMDVQVIGITGSVGKTSAKEAIASVLAQKFRVYKSPGNLNTEIGLPLSLLEAPDDAQILVLEMGGAYAFGELALLSSIARQRVGVVTNVYPVHLERMGTIEAIAETKTELVEALPPDGVAILNGDDFRVRAMARRTQARVVTFGLDPSNEIRADTVTTLGLKGMSFWITIHGDRRFVRIPFVGAHAVQIALIAMATGHVFGMDIAEMLLGLQDPSVQVRLLFVPGPNGAQLIDDTYNASTPSMLSSLSVLSDVQSGRRVAVLGDMREMGDVEEEEHELVGTRAGDVVDLLVTYGELARIFARAASEVERPPDRPLTIVSFAEEQRQELIDYLRSELRADDCVLLKGSRGLQMEDIVAALRSDVQPAGKAAEQGH